MIFLSSLCGSPGMSLGPQLCLQETQSVQFTSLHLIRMSFHLVNIPIEHSDSHLVRNQPWAYVSSQREKPPVSACLSLANGVKASMTAPRSSAATTRGWTEKTRVFGYSASLLLVVVKDETKGDSCAYRGSRYGLC